MLKKRIDYHLVWIDYPSQFMEVVGEIHGVRSTGILGYEGTRTFKCFNRVGCGEFNDFYAVGEQAEREIDTMLKMGHIKQYLLIVYDSMKEGRFDLGNNLGTIHRGTSIVIYYDSGVKIFI